VPVVINELDLVVEPPPAAPPAVTATRPPGLTPADIADVIRRLDERRARVRAD
jgi:hypothetical protein